MFSFLWKRKTWNEYFDEGMRYGAAGDFRRAEASFRAAVRRAPSEPYPHYELGYTLFLTGRHAEALSELRHTNELARGFRLVQQELFMCEQILGGQLGQEGLQVLRELQRLTDSGGAQSAKAARLARQAIELEPQCALGHFYLGKALIESDKPAAEQALGRCVELGADDTTAIDAKFHLGLLRQQAGEEAAARRIWREIVMHYPDNPHTKVAELMLGQEAP